MAIFDEGMMGDLTECSFKDIAKLRQEGPKSRDFVIQDVVLAKGVTLIYADVNVGKTRVSGDWAGCEATGTMWAPTVIVGGERAGGFATKQGIVVMLNLDDSDDIPEANAMATANMYCIEDDSCFKVFDNPAGFSLVSKDDLKALYRRLRGTDVTRIILDGLGLMSDGQENESMMKIAMNGANHLAKALDCGITLIHHTNKGGGDIPSLNSANGHKSITRYADQAVQLIESKTCAGVLEVHRLKVRGKEKSKRPILVRCVNETDSNGLTVGYYYMQVLDDGKEKAKSADELTDVKLEAKVIEFLQNPPDEYEATKTGMTTTMRALDSKLPKNPLEKVIEHMGEGRPQKLRNGVGKNGYPTYGLLEKDRIPPEERVTKPAAGGDKDEL